MSMTRNLTILLLFFLFLFSCSGNKKRVEISSDAIEGYWVSGFLLHNTDLSRSIASDNSKKPKVLLLRLKNSVNGFADTSYRVHGDTLFYRIKFKSQKLGLIEIKEEFYPFRVTFHSKDRLILIDDVTHQETTFYNISMLPGSQENFNEINFSEDALTINDSIKFNKEFDHDKIITNAAWRNNLNMLVGRINWKGAIFTRESVKPKILSLGEFKITTYETAVPLFVQIGIKTEKHSGNWTFRSQYSSDPALSVLIAELKTFEMYCYANGLLKYYTIL